jgi:hypothetical protein
MLTSFTNASYHESVSMAISFEEKNRLHQETKKRKLVPMGYSGGNNQRQRFMYQHGHHPPYRPPQQRG